MWILTIFPLVAYLLAGFQIAHFYDLWNDGWEGLATFIGLGLGIKFGKDTVIQRSQILANKAKTNVTFSETGSD